MKIENILKYIIYVGIFAILAIVPFIVASSLFFPFITGKGFVFRVITEIMLGAWAILALWDSSYRPKCSLILGSIVTFVGVMTLADIFGVYPLKSIWSNFERMEGLITLFHLLAYFVVTSTMLNTERLWFRFFHISIGASVLMCFYSLLQLAGKVTINQGGVRVDGTFGNASYLAVYLLFNIFITLFFLLRRQNFDLAKWVYGGVILLQSYVLYNTATRGAILGLIGGIMLTALLIFFFEKERKELRKKFSYLLIAVVVLVGSFIAMRNTSFVQDSPVLARFASISLSETTTASRFMIWDMAWQGVKENPMLGWGQENFNYVFNKYYNPQMFAQEQWFDRTHNVVFDWFVAGGFLGLISYLSIFVAVLYCLWRKNNNLSVVDRSVITGLLAGYFFQNLFIFDNVVSYIFFFLILAFVHSICLGSADKKEEGMNFGFSEKTLKTLTLIIIFSTLLLAYLINTKSFLSCRAFLQALSSHEEGISKNMEYFGKAISYDSFGNQEIREQLIQSAYKISQLNISLDEKKAFISFALEEMGKQIVKDPNNARLELFLGSVMGKLGGYDASLVHLEKALALSPNKQSIYFEIGSIYLNKKDYEKALEVLKKAFDLAPNYEKARTIYATAAVYAGDDKIINELLISFYGTDIIDTDDNLVRAYFETGQYEKVLKIWQMRVAKFPDVAQFHLSLGAAYIQVGQRQNAIGEIQKVIELKPEFKIQGEYFIEQIKAGKNP